MLLGKTGGFARPLREIAVQFFRSYRIAKTGPATTYLTLGETSGFEGELLL